MIAEQHYGIVFLLLDMDAAMF